MVMDETGSAVGEGTSVGVGGGIVLVGGGVLLGRFTSGSASGIELLSLFSPPSQIPRTNTASSVTSITGRRNCGLFLKSSKSGSQRRFKDNVFLQRGFF